MDLCFSHNSLKSTIFIQPQLFVVVVMFCFVFFYFVRIFPLPCPRDAAASGVRTWPRLGFSEAMSRAGLLPPRSGAFAPTCVGLDLLEPHY